MLFVGYDVLIDHPPDRRQAMEHIILSGPLSAMEITRGHARARRVHFRHRPVSPLPAYRRYFGCEVRFGQAEDGVLFAESDLAARIVDPDAEAYAAVTAFIDAEFTRPLPPVHAQARLDFARISERPGFAEQSVMTRGCNRWSGMSPTRLRAGG